MVIIINAERTQCYSLYTNTIKKGDRFVLICVINLVVTIPGIFILASF